MQCPKCQHENPSEALFCMKCGTKLERKCSKCGAEYPEEALFCMKCGAKLGEEATTPSTVAIPKLEEMQDRLYIPEPLKQQMEIAEKKMAGENRVVTVLFADISGFTPMSEQLTPEEVVEKVNQCLQVITEAVHQYEGSVNRFIGDCLLAFFGAPLSHENDPERAILAALDMQEAVSKLGLSISVGINTGMMYFGPVGTKQHLEISAYGTDINFAKRLQEAAQAGQILVGGGTYRFTLRTFDFQHIPFLTFKGIAKPVSAYKVLKPLPKPDKIRGIEGLKSEMIGREKEFGDLKKCVDELFAGRGQIVSIIGEAGVGKTRLVTELKAYLERREEWKDGRMEEQQSEIRIPKSEFRWLEGRCVSIGESIGYWVFTEILRNYLEFSKEESEKEIGEKIVDKMKALFPEKWEDICPYIGNFLSVKFGNEWDEKVRYLPPEQLKYQTYMILKDLFLNLAQQKPLLLILEDLHWADNLSLDLLSLFMDELTHAPLMLLCIYRPEKEHKSWRIGTIASGKCLDRYSEITLRELNTQESRRLVESLQIENFPEKVKESILRKTAGNPFFVEEVIRSLIQSGFVYWDSSRWVARTDVEEIAVVPDTIQSVIMARIDSLEDEVRYVLQCASVIGKVFRHRLLQHAAGQYQNLDRYLWQLQEKSLIYEERAIPELEYSFKHVLIQETLYQNLLARHRQALHRKIGDGIEMFYQDRVEELYEELAWHYSESGYMPKAIDYLLKAGEKAKRIYANEAAISYTRRALEFLQSQTVDEKQVSLEIKARELLGDVLFTTGTHQEAEVQLKRALNLASQQQDAWYIASLACKLADMVHWQGEYDRAIEIAKSGLTALGYPLTQSHYTEAANLLEVISRSYHAKEDLESASRYASQIAQIIRQIPYFDSIYKLYYWIAWIELGAGNVQAATDWLEELERICLTHNNEVGLARCYHGLGDFWRGQNDFRQASQWLEKSLSYCERTGDAHLLLEGYLELAYLLILLDENPSRIETHIQMGMEIAEQMANTPHVASAPALCRMLGDAYRGKGDIKQALFYFHRGIEFGPHDSVLVPLLSRLEPLYVQQGKHKEFFDFCQRTEQQKPFQSQTSLRYWHLKPYSPSEAYSQLTWWDSFKGPSLREEWRWIDSHGKSSYNFVQQGLLELHTPAGHTFSSTSVPRLLHQISGDFAVETRLVDITEKECQIGGLLLWASESMYLTFGKRLSSTNEVRLEVYRQSHHEIIGRGWFPGPQLYLRLERNGQSVSVLCSNDGKNWQSCGETSFSVDNPIWIGLYVACPANLPDSVVRFKEFKLFQKEAR